MNRDEIQIAYAALPPMPEFPFERVWCQRLNTFEKFMQFGPYQAQCLRDITRDQRDVEQFRCSHPAMWDLMMAAFPPGPHRVREPGVDVG